MKIMFVCSDDLDISDPINGYLSDYEKCFLEIRKALMIGYDKRLFK